jgi:hypothetical protein
MAKNISVFSNLKITQIGIFGKKINHLATLAATRFAWQSENGGKSIVP